MGNPKSSLGAIGIAIRARGGSAQRFRARVEHGAIREGLVTFGGGRVVVVSEGGGHSISREGHGVKWAIRKAHLDR